MAAFSVQSKLGDLLSNDASKAVLEKHLPGISNHPQIAMARGFTLAAVAPLSGGMITAEALQKIDTDLSTLA